MSRHTPAFVALALAALLAAPSAVAADDRAETPSALAFDLKLEDDGFRVDHRLFGPFGLATMAWLEGRRGPAGLTLDGRLGAGRRALDFAVRAGRDGASIRWWRE